MTEITDETRSMAMVATLAGVAAALALSAGALIVSAGSSSPPLPAVPAAADDADSEAPAQLSVELGEMFIAPDGLEIAPGGTLEVTNAGAAVHDLAVEGTDVATPMLDPGESAPLELGDLEPGIYTLFCTVAGHREAGMEATLVIDGADATASDETTEADPAAEMDDTTYASFDPNAAPPDGFEARDPRLPAAPDQDVHEITIRAAQIEGEVAPGVTQELWTFDDTVPGPTLRGQVGDLFRITFINDGEMGHSIDFHSSKVDPATEMRTIEPGEQLVYEFEAKHAGVWMYHCGSAPVLHHTGNGQYGMMIVDPPDLGEVDHEYAFVQSEFHLGPEGEPGDYTKMLAGTPDVVAFNGYANGYVHDPITDVKTGERVRVWLLNAGPSESSAFHVIGTIFDTVYKEGDYRLTPAESASGGAQALDLKASQGGFVEFTFDTDGFYPFVTHEFVNVPKGALGAFVVGDVGEDASH
jgi:nitrite reductase (NO-forming)